MPNKPAIFRFVDIEVREREFSLTKAGEALSVEPKAFRVLLILLRNPQKLIPKDELLNAVWGDTAVSENSLARSIALLRKLLGDEARTPRFIETVATVGYRWVSKVEVSEESSGEAEPLPEPALPRRRLPKWLIPSVAVLVIGSALCVWYASRPLPALTVSQYVPLTHDGHIQSAVGTDGSRIYFDSSPWGSVEEVSVSGGEVEKVPIDLPRIGIDDVSPDGSSLLVSSYDPKWLWIVGSVGTSPRLVSKGPFGGSLTWSPDGTHIAYFDNSSGLDNQGALALMRSDGTENHKLVDVKGTITSIAWSPDGSRIRYTLDDALWEVSSSGSNPHPLFPAWHGPAGQCCGKWTPDGDFFVFLAGGNSRIGPAAGAFEQMWALDERHGILRRAPHEPVQLTSGPIHWEPPVPSRDGRKIFASGNAPRGELVRFDSKTNEFKPFLGGVSAEFLTFSKDGGRVAYVTFPDGVLWQANRDGSERRQLTSSPTYPTLCRWSPDQTKLLFTAKRNSSSYALYVVAAEGGKPELLAPHEEVGQEDGTWSPDGRKVAYSISPDGPNPVLRIFDLDRGESAKIPGSDGLFSPRWSPDGNYIAAMKSDWTEIRLFDLRTRQWSTLVQNIGGWGFPTWSHDSKSVYAITPVGGMAVYRFSLRGEKPARVVDLAGFHPTGYLSFWFGLDPDDAPLLLRDNGTNDIYALTLEVK